MRKNKLLLLLALLMTAVTGAWAKTYTVTFGGFGNNAMNTSVTYNSMPQEINSIKGIPIDIYEAFGRDDMAGVNGVSVISGGNGKVSARCDSWEDVVIVVNGSFSGTATIRINASYYIDPDDWDEAEISRDITVRCEESAAAFYTVTYDANGGTGAPSAQEKKVDVDIVLSSTVPTRDDYRFTGWNTESDGSGDSYAPGATYTTNAALNLYAQWVPIYIVSLKVGTEDFANWAISPTPAEAGQTVTATYSGKKKVKSVKAVKKPKGNGSLQDYNVTTINE